jgi:hypothetical protein
MWSLDLFTIGSGGEDQRLLAENHQSVYCQSIPEFPLTGEYWLCDTFFHGISVEQQWY